MDDSSFSQRRHEMVIRAETIALDFVDKANRVTDVGEMVQCINDVGEQFGMNCFLSGGLPSDKDDPGITNVLLNGWPDEWFLRYMGNDYIHQDVVISTLRNTINPFRWTDCIKSVPKKTTSSKIFNEAREFNLNDGFAIPIYSYSGAQSGISFGTDKYELGARDEMALLIIGIYAFNRTRELQNGSENSAIKKVMGLSPREFECLRWISIGKTNWEISQILSLSQRTIDSYVASMYKKMDVVNRASAIALACQAQVI